MSNELNITINQGEDFYRLLTITADSTTLDLTNYTLRGQIRPSYAAPVDYEFAFTVLDQVTKKGQVEMTMANTVLDTLVMTKDVDYVYDVELVSTGMTEMVTRIMKGKATITPQVTR